MPKRIFLSPPWIGRPEREAVSAAFDSGYVAPCGPLVDEFDRRLGRLAGQYAAAVSSGTAALDLLMAELNVGPETIVVSSSLTFIATVGPAVHRGARPVFVDSDPVTGTLSIPLLESALRAIRRVHRGPVIVLPADIYGQCCDYDALEEVCERFDATLVVDAAESVGATSRGRPAGCAGAAAVYSFNGNKIVTTSGGGAVLSRNQDLVARAKWRAQQAREQVVHYEHREVGYNYRMSNLLGGLGCAQLGRLPEIVRRKQRTFAAYCDLFGCTPDTPFRPRSKDVQPFPCDASCTTSTRWLSVFIFPSSAARDAVAARLDAANIENRPVWKPMHLQPVFNGCRVWGGDVSEALFRRGLCLPSGAGLSSAQFRRVTQAIRGV